MHDKYKSLFVQQYIKKALRKNVHNTYIEKRFKVEVAACSTKILFTRTSLISTVKFDLVEMNSISIPEFSLYLRTQRNENPYSHAQKYT